MREKVRPFHKGVEDFPLRIEETVIVFVNVSIDDWFDEPSECAAGL